MGCSHPKLILLEGALHPSGKDYQCDECKEFFKATLEPLAVTVSMGMPESLSSANQKEE